MLNNLLQVSLMEFKRGTKVFQRKRLKLGPVLLAYENEFLSIESGEATAVMNATGEWHGRAMFSPEILRALAMFPPLQDPVKISYDDGHLFVGSINLTLDVCRYDNGNQARDCRDDRRERDFLAQLLPLGQCFLLGRACKKRGSFYWYHMGDAKIHCQIVELNAGG